jgi:DNA-binding XRE family transcriptional regulator
VSTQGTTFEKRHIRDWGVPGAPQQHDKGRLCAARLSQCASAEQTGELGRVSIYAEEIGGVLLCEACRRKCVRHDIRPTDLTNEPIPTTGYGPKTPGYYLPNLKRLRKARGLDRWEVAAAAECHYKTLDKIENEKVKPSLALCNRLALAVGANLKDLREEEEAA